MVDRDLLLRKASDLEQYLGQLAEYRGVRSRYEITYTSRSISLRLLMPFRNVSAQLIL